MKVISVELVLSLLESQRINAFYGLQRAKESGSEIETRIALSDLSIIESHINIVNTCAFDPKPIYVSTIDETSKEKSA